MTLILVAVGGYFVGVHRGSRTTVRTGNFYVGEHVASAKVGGWAYGLNDSVSWVDRHGSSHEAGWPDCLGPTGTMVRVKFGEVRVQGPNGDSWREIAWIDCRGARVITP